MKIILVAALTFVSCVTRRNQPFHTCKYRPHQEQHAVNMLVVPVVNFHPAGRECSLTILLTLSNFSSCVQSVINHNE